MIFLMIPKQEQRMEEETATTEEPQVLLYVVPFDRKEIEYRQGISQAFYIDKEMKCWVCGREKTDFYNVLEFKGMRPTGRAREADLEIKYEFIERGKLPPLKIPICQICRILMAVIGQKKTTTATP